MFDLSSSKLFLLAVIALLVVGPRDLPQLLRTVGRYVGMVRRQAAEFRAQFDDAMRESEIADLKRQVEDFGREAETAMREAESAVQKEADAIKAEATGTLAEIDATVKGEHELVAAGEAAVPATALDTSEPKEDAASAALAAAVAAASPKPEAMPDIAVPAPEKVRA